MADTSIFSKLSTRVQKTIQDLTGETKRRETQRLQIEAEKNAQIKADMEKAELERQKQEEKKLLDTQTYWAIRTALEKEDFLSFGQALDSNPDFNINYTPRDKNSHNDRYTYPTILAAYVGTNVAMNRADLDVVKGLCEKMGAHPDGTNDLGEETAADFRYNPVRMILKDDQYYHNPQIAQYLIDRGAITQYAKHSGEETYKFDLNGVAASLEVDLLKDLLKNGMKGTDSVFASFLYNSEKLTAGDCRFGNKEKLSAEDKKEVIELFISQGLSPKTEDFGGNIPVEGMKLYEDILKSQNQQAKNLFLRKALHNVNR